MSRHPHRLDERWHVIEDPARGRRRVALDAADRVLRVEAADGSVLHLRRNGRGLLERVEAEDCTLVTLEPAEAGRFRIGDRTGVTEVEVERDGYTLQRAGEALRLERDGAGRIRRVFLPGSSAPLTYDWRMDGSCRIGDVVEMRPTAHGARLLVAGATLEEKREPLGVRLASGADAVEIGWDLIGRTMFRRWSDGFGESFARDASGRLSVWTHGEIRRSYAYAGAELSAEHEVGRQWTRELDACGRVAALVRPDGTRIAYAYDAAGRRVRRDAARYEYDAFGQLTAVTAESGALFHFGYDGLGRRIAVETPEGGRREHRDASGRLWAITDAHGRALHVFLWWQDRMLARLDGPVGSLVAETFVTDHAGTLIGILRSDGIDRIVQPPFGAVHGVPRPALYGHIGDPETGLIACGARLLDPELGLFLTPDPWHGGADDPRRWAGASARELRLSAEIPIAGVHPYALCQFDPTGLTDPDGHQSKARGTGCAAAELFLNVILTSTWGWPLTAVSLGFFLPVNFYWEAVWHVLVCIVNVFSSKAATGMLRVFQKLSLLQSVPPFVTGSSRQGILAATFNGLLPRMFAPDSAMTIGNVVWVDSRKMDLLKRPMVLLVDNLAGFNLDPFKLSVVLIEAMRNGKKRFFAGFWSRGFGNAVHDVGGEATFDDIAVGGVSQAAIHLANPFPLGFPSAKENTPTLQEYRHDLGLGPGGTADKKSEATVVRDIWFAVRVSTDTSLKKDDPIEIKAPTLPAEPAVHLTISEAQKGRSFTTIILSGPLPANYQNAQLAMNVSRLKVPEHPVETEWVAGGANTELKVAAPADAVLNLSLATDAPLRITGAGGPPVPTQFTRVKQIEVTLKLSTALTDNVIVNDKLRRLVDDDSGPFEATVLDPPADDKFKWKGSHDGIKTDDLVSISTGAPDKITYGVVKASADDSLEVELAAPALVAAAGTLKVRKVKDNEKDDDAGTFTAAAKDDIPVKVGRIGLFAANLRVHCKANGKDQVRTITSVGEVKITVTDAAPGAAPFKVAFADVDKDSTETDAKFSKVLRFLEVAAGATLPPDFGNYPDALLEVRTKGLSDAKRSKLSRFFAQTGAGDFEETFRNKWKPLDIGGKHYFALEADLPYEEEGGKIRWRYDPNEDPGFGYLTLSGRVPAGDEYKVELREFKKAGGASRNTVTVVEPQVQVPEYPSTVDTHADALWEHELHHAVQNMHWGPLLGMLPIGLEALAQQDAAKKAVWLTATDDEKRAAVDQFKGAQYVSVGSLMRILWMYAFTFGQSRLTKFEDWNRIFNPLAGNLIAKYPDIDPNAPFSDRPVVAVAQILNALTDLRSWIFPGGWVPLWLRPGPRSFLEQGASRASGDLYSTILSADDKFNRETNLSPDYHSANISRPLGKVVRLMLYESEQTDRTLKHAFCNLPGSPVTYNSLSFSDDEPLTITADADVLVHPALGEAIGVGATVKLAGPRSNPGPVDFVRITMGDSFRLGLRSVVPTPLRVTRSTGWYFIAVTPTKYFCEAFYGDAGKPDQDAKTQHVELTIEAGAVSFAGEAVAYVAPVEVGLPAPPSTFDRFVGERPEIVIKDQPVKDPDWWQINVTDLGGNPFPAPALVTADKQAQGWKLTIAKALPAGAPAAARVRIYRIFKKNDVNDDTKNDPAFDLTFDPKEHPTLKNVRSYLSDDLWIPVREFVFTVQPLPTLSADGNPVTVDSEQEYLLDLTLPLNGDVKPVTALVKPATGAPAQLQVEKTGAKGHYPRGQQWRVKPLGPVLEETANYRISVTYEGGAAPAPLDFTVNPHIGIAMAPDKPPGQADFTASEANPCKLTITGGVAPYEVSGEGFPAKVSPALSDGNTIVVAVGASPAAETQGVVIVTDNNGTKGRRTVKILKS